MLNVLWAAAVATFVVAWVSLSHSLFVALASPLAMLVLSFAVFDRFPKGLRLTHHVIVGALTLIAIVGFIASVYFGREQPGVGAIFLGYTVGAAYLGFTVVLLFFFGMQKWRSRTSRAARSQANARAQS
jgi:uncharacterized membrane protein